MSLNVGNVASRVIIVAESRTPVAKAASLMREHHVGALIVIEDAPPRDRPIGIVTDRDLVVEVLAMDVDYRNLTVGEVMTPDPTTVKESDAILDALEVMQKKGVRRLPVLDRESRLVGVLTMDDLVELLAQEMGGLAKAIRAGERHEKQARLART